MDSRCRDVVVVLPGLIGSVLQKDGKDLWGTSPGAMWRVVAGNALRQMSLAAPDNGDDDLGDGIVATGLVPNAEIVPGLWKQGGYSRLSAGLVPSLGLKAGSNYFEFAYDWRRDNRVSARRLARQAHGWVAAWRERSGNADAKLVLVAHSMGGLVARHFIECLEGWKSVRALVTFGTPFRGSGNALDFLCNGFEWKAGPVTAFDGTDALRTFDSVYQLLPTYRFVAVSSGSLARLDEVELPGLDASRVRSASAFHRDIAAAQDRNSRDTDYIASCPTVRPVVGIEQPTWQSASWDGQRLEMSREIGGKSPGGDGTVSRVSAVPLELEHARATYVATTHSALQSVAGAIEHLRGVLGEADIELGDYRAGAESLDFVRLLVGDTYPSGQAVRVEAEASGFRQSLDAEIERLDAPGRVKARMWPTGEVYGAGFELPPGLYRVTVTGEAVFPASDVFLVLDAAEGLPSP